MILSLTAINKQVQFRSFSCQLTDLEVALDVLSKITKEGSKILTAHIVDENGRVELSVDAFDGESLTDPIHQLEKQWQAILNEPARSVAPPTNWHIELTHQRIKLLEARITQTTFIITRLEQFRQRVETTRDEICRDELVQYYNASLKTYRQHIDRARIDQQAAQRKLKQLQKS